MITTFKDIIEYREKLLTTSIDEVFADCRLRSATLLADLEHDSSTAVPLISLLKNMNFVADSAAELFNNHKDDISGVMLARTPQFYVNEYDLYVKTIVDSTATTYLNREIELSTRTYECVKSRLLTYVNWKLPCLHLFPGFGKFTDFLVGADPLYLVDIKLEYLAPIKQKYTKQYQDRLRYYVVENDIDCSSLFNIDSQLGFVFAWSFFNYRPRHLTKQYMEKLYKMLRPGGTVMFSYNNCERVQCYMLYQNQYAAFITKTELIQDLTDLGYEIIASFDEDSTISWIEVKKPGELTSNRAGQTLASIINVKENK